MSPTDFSVFLFRKKTIPQFAVAQQMRLTFEEPPNNCACLSISQSNYKKKTSYFSVIQEVFYEVNAIKRKKTSHSNYYPNKARFQ